MPLTLLFSHGSGILEVADPPYNAVGDGVTDDTAAIQAAIDASGVGGRVYLPPPAPWYAFSNLKLKAYMSLEGPLMAGQSLLRIPGSTGTAIREKTAAEGNPNGASGLWMRNIRIHGNSTSGDGLDVGSQVVGAQLNFLSGLENVFVSNFASGTGMKINQNGAKCSYLWSNTNNVGIQTAGGGSLYDGLWAEGNAAQNLILGGLGDTYSGIQTEGGGATESIRITGSSNTIHGAFLGIGLNSDKLVLIKTGAVRNRIRGLHVNLNGAFSYNHTIYVEAWSAGTGVQSDIDWTDTAGSTPTWFYDQSTNETIKIGGHAITGATLPATGITYSASMTPDLSVASYNNIAVTDGNAMTINAPANGASGDELTLNFQNSSGGAMGLVTWNSTYKLAGAFTNPANGKYRNITFFHNGAFWIEKNRAQADI